MQVVGPEARIELLAQTFAHSGHCVNQYKSRVLDKREHYSARALTLSQRSAMPSAPVLSIGAVWRAEDVFWRSAPKNGKMLGVHAKAMKGPTANFAHQSGIYVLYSDFTPIYVGQANTTLFARLKQHHETDDLVGRWDRFTWFGFRKVVGGKKPRLSKPGVDFHVSPSQLLDHLEAIS